MITILISLSFLSRRFKEEKTSTTKPWAKYNSYWDEKTIDIQWLDKERKKKIRSFKKSKK